MPRDDGVRLHKDERCPPLGSDAREPHPEAPVRCAETEAWSARPFEDLQLMSERENLEVQGHPRAKQRTQRQEHGDDEGHHGSKPCGVDKNLNNPARTDFLVGTGPERSAGRPPVHAKRLSLRNAADVELVNHPRSSAPRRKRATRRPVRRRRTGRRGHRRVAVFGPCSAIPGVCQPHCAHNNEIRVGASSQIISR